LLEQGGSIVLGDFNAPLIQPTDIDLDAAPIAAIEFEERDRARVDDVLQSIKNYHYSVEYLERRVNDTLGSHFEETLGELACTLAQALDFDLSEVNVEGAGLCFPGGSYSIVYESNDGDKKNGAFVHTVSFDSSWFERAGKIPAVLKALEMRPKEFTLQLSNSIDPQKLIAGLRARNWRISKKLDDKIEAVLGTYQVLVQPDSVTFSGLTPSEILGDGADKQKSQIVAGVLLLMA
jgi:hypothetical protein